MAQGRDNAKIFLKDNPEILEALEAEIRKELNGPIPLEIGSLDKDAE